MLECWLLSVVTVDQECNERFKLTSPQKDRFETDTVCVQQQLSQLKLAKKDIQDFVIVLKN